MADEVATDRCPACGSEERDELVDGSIQCGDCCWPIYSEISAYTAMGMTPDGRKFPETTLAWAPCPRCGLAHDGLPVEGSASCQECDQELVPWVVREYTPRVVLHELRERWEEQRRHRIDQDDLQPGDSVVSSDLVGGGPFTRLFVLAVHDEGEVDLVRDDDGTTWRWVPHEHVAGLVW